MPPKSGQHRSFADGLMAINHSLADMELAPDADPNFIGQMRQMLVSYHQQAQQGAAGGGMGASAQSSPAPGGMPVPLPTTEGDMSRGPKANPDMSGATDQLARIMNGA